jgi:hypothetical protein
VTPLQEWEQRTGVRLYCCERHEEPSGGRYFLLSWNGRSKGKYPTWMIRSASNLNFILDYARREQGNTRKYAPVTTTEARHLLSLLHAISEASPSCDALTTGETHEPTDQRV